ncbi:MAG: pentapeptide repeat-containing protein [Candidatus Caenarcaniphilales bacterium]|nr:pentapeptide repeat-containing protein [Candidatus Caenarcaniphilales bacterium]
MSIKVKPVLFIHKNPYSDRKASAKVFHSARKKKRGENFRSRFVPPFNKSISKALDFLGFRLKKLGQVEQEKNTQIKKIRYFENIDFSKDRLMLFFLKEALRNKRKWSGYISLSGCNLGNVSFDGLPLSRIDFSAANLEGAFFRGL